MTKDEIKARCRKVYIQLEGNRIFGDPAHDFQFITIFKTPESAE